MSVTAVEHEKELVARLKVQIEAAANTVPCDVINGSTQTTRQWLSKRDVALKMCKKAGVTSAQLMGALNTLKGSS